MAYLDLNLYNVNVKWIPQSYYSYLDMAITASRLQVKVYPKQPYSVKYTFEKHSAPKEEIVINRPYLIDILVDNKNINNYITINKGKKVKVNYNKIINDTKTKINSMFENGQDIIDVMTKKINIKEKAVV